MENEMNCYDSYYDYDDNDDYDYNYYDDCGNYGDSIASAVVRCETRSIYLRDSNSRNQC